MSKDIERPMGRKYEDMVRRTNSMPHLYIMVEGIEKPKGGKCGYVVGRTNSMPDLNIMLEDIHKPTGGECGDVVGRTNSMPDLNIMLEDIERPKGGKCGYVGRTNSTPDLNIMLVDIERPKGGKCGYVVGRTNSMPHLNIMLEGIERPKGGKCRDVVGKTNSKLDLYIEANNCADDLNVLQRQSASSPHIGSAWIRTYSQCSIIKNSIGDNVFQAKDIQMDSVNPANKIPDMTNEEVFAIFGGFFSIDKVSDYSCTILIDKMLTAETIAALEHAADVVEGTDQRDLHNLLKMSYGKMIGYMPICLRILQGRIAHFRTPYTAKSCGASMQLFYNQYHLEEIDCPRFVRIYGSSGMDYDDPNAAPIFSLIVNREVYRGQRTTLCLIIFYCTLFVRLTLFCWREYYSALHSSP